MEDFGAQFDFSIAATSFLEFNFSIATLPEQTCWNTTLVLQPLQY